MTNMIVNVIPAGLLALVAWAAGLLQGTRRFNRRPPGKHTSAGLAAGVAESPAETTDELAVILGTPEHLFAPQEAPQDPWAGREYPRAPEPSVYARNVDPTRTRVDA